ncbi:MAG: zinc-binding alcohol dehydrogenase family protein [Blastocatellia bacterium]
MRVAEWQTPRPAAGEALVSVAACGICAGDLHIYHGRNPYASYPQICGHEIAGVVAEVGSGVTGFSAGDQVVVEPFLGCGKCYPCRTGKRNCCARLQIKGVTQPGGCAEMLVSPVENVHRVPAGLPLSTAALAEPLAVAVQACRRGNVQAGELALILGCGPIGLALIEIAKARGARIIATDLIESRLETAAMMGVETLPADENLLPGILELTDGEGATVVIEATGNVRAIEQTVDLVTSGGRIVIVGLIKEGLTASFPALDFTRKEMTIVGSRASVGCFPESLQMLASGNLLFPKIAAEFDLWDAPKVFAEMSANPSFIHKGVLVRETK